MASVSCDVWNITIAASATLLSGTARSCMVASPASSCMVMHVSSAGSHLRFVPQFSAIARARGWSWSFHVPHYLRLHHLLNSQALQEACPSPRGCPAPHKLLCPWPWLEHWQCASVQMPLYVQLLPGAALSASAVSSRFASDRRVSHPLPHPHWSEPFVA